MTNLTNDEAAEFAQAVRDHEAREIRCGLNLTPPEAIQSTIDARREALDVGQETFTHGNEPVDLGDFGAGTLAGAYNKPEPKVRDCDVPATLRAVDIPATAHSNAIQQWFDNEDDMQQFLAGRCLYGSNDRSIKDEEGNLVGMWFYAHFGPTPVS